MSRNRPPTFIKTVHGADLSVDFDNLDVYASIYNSGGTWEGNVMECCRQLLRPGDTFYDIGANAGVFSIDLAKSVDNLNIIAFEPQPSLAKHIRRSISANLFTRIALFEIMLGEQDEQSILYLTSHSVHASAVPREAKHRELPAIMRRLDGVAKDPGVAPPDLIKIDIEGGELAVFRGAVETLRVHQPSVVFEADANMVRHGYTSSDLFKILSAAAAYSYFLIGPNGDLEPIPEVPPDGNYLALSPLHHDRVSPAN